MQNSASPLDIARLPRRAPARCPERLGFDAKVYIRCERPPGHPAWCWAQGWSWNTSGDDQDRRYKPYKPAPRDVVVPWVARAVSTRRATHGRTQPPRANARQKLGRAG